MRVPRQLHGPVVAVNHLRVAVGHYSLWVALQAADQRPQQLRQGHVVALGYPEVLAPVQPDAPLPLQEGIAGVLLVGNDMADVRMVLILVDDRQAVVGRAVVKDDELEVLKLLP